MNNRLINFNLSHYTKNLEGDILTGMIMGMELYTGGEEIK